jgi:hypothetical protein
MNLATPLLLAALAFQPAHAADAATPAASDLYRGWLHMYDLKFDEAHRTFDTWKQSHGADPLGPASNAAAYLFAELARLGALESELFIDDQRYLHRTALTPDAQVKARFNDEVARAEQLADSALRGAANDPSALFVKSLDCGLRADYAALIEKRDFAALGYTKQGRVFADRLMAVNPQAYDAYLGPGVENYLLSLKPAPLRVLLRLTGSRIDREKGIEQLQQAAAHGHYLEPFAKLLLAVAAMRDKNTPRARELLAELHTRFPNNPLFTRELERLDKPAR